MNAIEIEECLQSFEILADTREQPSKRASERYASFGCPYRRQTLSYGDYTYNFILPSGKALFEPNTTAEGHCVIERKMNLDELSGCFCHERDRFRREFERASENNATIYLLVEDATWENLINGKYRSKFNSKAFLASITAWSVRYNIKIIFCKHETSGKLIKEILYRELKERLETGFYG
jgi:hypothetical protein